VFFELSINIVDGGTDLIVECDYNTDLFDRQSISRWLSHFRVLLESIDRDPEVPIASIPLLTNSERRTILEEWNPSGRAIPCATVPEQFAAQVHTRRDAIAVVFEDRHLTYGELDTYSSQLPHHLRDLGVGPEVVVGLCVERSLEMLIGLVGIVKAGGAYLPLDPNYPPERLAFMLRDAHAQVLVTHSTLVSRLPADDGRRNALHIVCLNADWPVITRLAVTGPAISLHPQNTLYVTYTSGSTGTPKGVMVAHHSVVRLVKNSNYVEIAPDDVFLHLAPLSFDASTFEIWGALLNGAKLVIYPDGRVDMPKLKHIVVEAGISVLWLTAALFEQVVDEILPALARVRQLLAGGDVLSVSHVRQFLEAHSGCGLINGYGPTEGTTFSVCFSATDQTNLDGSVPIGRPISNTRVYVLDGSLELVPIGVCGELYIAGGGLARGYLGQAGMTAERFVADPYGAQGTRMYRSGDLARWRSDGVLEFLGRADAQVKVRGFRIEPGEIEAALVRHASVRQAAVVARGDQAGDKCLVAYVVPSGAELIDAPRLRAHIGAYLPEYMLPSIFVELEQLPLTSNGKLDRRALPAPGITVSGARTLPHTAQGEIVPPRTATEQLVARIMHDCLERDDFGIFDSFFDVGGHSLAAIRLMTRLRAETGLDLPLGFLFERRSIAAISEALDALHWASGPLSTEGEEVEL